MRKLLAVLALAFLPLLAGCPSVPTLPDSKSLPPTANVALKAIVSAKAALDVAYDFIGSGVKTGAIEPKQGRVWFNTLDEYKTKVKQAEDLYNAGGFDAAKAQAAGTEALIKFVHEQAIKYLQEQAKKPAVYVLEFEFHPVWRKVWTPQPQH